MKYRIFAALHEEATEGWVWLATPPTEPHRLIILKNLELKSRPTVYCEARSIDDNFLKFYNDRKHTFRIDEGNYDDVLILGDWYRQALGIPATGVAVDLEVQQPRNPFWPTLRAGSQHPDTTVRLANRLGLLGAWLGLLGLGPVGAEFLHVVGQLTRGNCGILHSAGSWFSLAVLAVGVVCGWGARGVRRVRSRV
jgi:hypothetical protein